MPVRPLQEVCCMDHAIKYNEIKKQIQAKKDFKEARKSLKNRSDYLREAQTIFNKYIRLRDWDKPCISCGRYHTGQYHAGHYRTVGSNPSLRFNELNVHKQCAPCNNHLSGNIIEYRKGLIERIGITNVDFLEGNHKPNKYTIEEIEEIKALYRLKIKELERVNN